MVPPARKKQKDAGEDRTVPQPPAEAAGADGPTQQGPEQTTGTVGDVADMPDVGHGQDDADEEPAEHQFDDAMIDNVAESRVGSAEHPEHSEQPVADARQPDAAAEDRQFGRHRADGQEDVDGERGDMAELVFDLRAEEPEPVEIEKQVDARPRGTGRGPAAARVRAGSLPVLLMNRSRSLAHWR